MINLDYGRYNIIEEKVTGQDFILGTVEYEDVLLRSVFHSCSFTFMRKKFLWPIAVERVSQNVPTALLNDALLFDNAAKRFPCLSISSRVSVGLPSSAKKLLILAIIFTIVGE